MEICNQFDFKSPDCCFETCFETFDQDKNESISLKDFKQLCYCLFKNELNQKYLVRDQNAREMFAVFDKNINGFLERNEFQFCWDNWIQTIINPKSALLVIDVQNDFITGAMDIRNCPSHHNGYSIINPINRLLNTVTFDVVAYVMDWHPKDHISFVENVTEREIHPSSKVKAEEAEAFSVVRFAGPPMVDQLLWPAHCVENTWGAQLHDNLKILRDGIIIHKGTDSNFDSYSAFFSNEKFSETELNGILQDNGITDVYICGIAMDYSVGQTAEDSISLGYRSIIIEDCCVGINPNNYKRISENFLRNNGLITKSDNVENITKGMDRRPELGYGLAMNFR